MSVVAATLYLLFLRGGREWQLPYATAVLKSKIEGKGQVAMRDLKAYTVVAAALVPDSASRGGHRITKWASMINHSNSANTALIYNARDDTYYEM